MFNADAFLDPDVINGYKGLQSTVLKPGLHRVNLFLFNVRITDRQGKSVIYDRNGARYVSGGYKPTIITEIPTDSVGVVKSNLDEGWNPACKEGGVQVKQGHLKAVLVPSGCKGVWKKTYEPGAYFFNPEVYEVTQIPTRAQRWTYKGGFEKCRIDLTIGDTGSFEQMRICEPVKFQSTDHADHAIFVKVEGWDIPVELRILVQVNPEDAAAVVAAVGSVQEVEDRIVTPAIRSIVRNIGGGSYLAPLLDKNGDIQVGEDGKPVVGLRPTRALDFQDFRSYLETAFEQSIKQEGEKAGLTQVAEGQKAQALVLGEDIVARLRALELVIDAVKDQPQILTGLKLPSTFVMGVDGTDLTGAAAVFGAKMNKDNK